jgi:uncharacterized membrane protein
MSTRDSVATVCCGHTGADQLVKELQRCGVDLQELAIVEKGYHTDERVVSCNNTGGRMKYWTKTGAFYRGVWGLLFGSFFFVIPGIGPLLVSGPWLRGSWGSWKVRWWQGG